MLQRHRCWNTSSFFDVPGLQGPRFPTIQEHWYKNCFVLPRYGNVLVIFSFCAFKVIDGLSRSISGSGWHSTSVFFVQIVKSNVQTDLGNYPSAIVNLLHSERICHSHLHQYFPLTSCSLIFVLARTHCKLNNLPFVLKFTRIPLSSPWKHSLCILSRRTGWIGTALQHNLNCFAPL
jgi:hypothetical protein